MVFSTEIVQTGHEKEYKMQTKGFLGPYLSIPVRHLDGISFK